MDHLEHLSDSGNERKQNRPSSQQFVCLNCGRVMVQRHCKVRCTRCGYFEDCSDGGNDQTNVIVK